MDDEVQAVLAEEKEEKAMTVAERDIKKGENLVVHETEILSRPKRTWFETDKDKKAAKDRGRAELNGAAVVAKKEKKKLSNKQKKALDMRDERKASEGWKGGKSKASAKMKAKSSKGKGKGKKQK